jgi:uncharacterized phage protein gp47/JayE
MSSPVFPLATVACTVDATGISAPGVSDILSSFQASTQSIYGSDIYIDPDSKDGQFLAAFAQAQSDSNQATIASYNSYNPQTALGTALDGAVKTNGIVREAASNSTVTVSIGGVAGTLIFSGQVQDNMGNLWNLPDLVTIPPAGTIDVTATAVASGNIVALRGAVSIPFTVTLGWDTVTNDAPAEPGSPVETDGALRERQSVSTSINAETTLAAIEALVANQAGVSRTKIYENDSNIVDANGLPPSSIAVVVLGGDIADVARAIQTKKNVGCKTFGTTTVDVVDTTGLIIPINFSTLTEVPYYANVTITALAGYTAATGSQIQAALATFVSGLDMGETIYLDWARAVAGLSGVQQQTFVITAFTQGTAPNPAGTVDIPIAFSSAATSVPANITVTVLP